MKLPRDGAQDREAGKQRRRNERVAPDAHVKLAIVGFVEAVLGIAVGGEDSDFVAEVLETDCCVDDEAFCAADAEVGVEEDYVLRLGF
jgi:hypothetical protein